jgi:hypothetical protein
VVDLLGIAGAEHHDHGDDHEDQAAGDGQRADREVQQAPQHPAQDQEEHRHDGGGREHLARDASLRRVVHVGGDLQEWYERDLGADADEQQQEKVSGDGEGDRLVVHEETSQVRFHLPPASGASSVWGDIRATAARSRKGGESGRGAVSPAGGRYLVRPGQILACRSIM